MKSLKSLQADWRTNETIGDRSKETFIQCADALTPFVEREAKDMELIRKLIDALCSEYHDGYQSYCPECQVVAAARLRLTEQE